MPDYIGNIEVPTVTASGTFPIERHWPFFMAIEPEIVVHQFGAGNAKREQRFYLSAGMRRWEMNQVIGEDDLVTLMSFWESHQGGYQPFTFYAPSASQTFAAYNAQFENEPLVWEHLPGQQVRVTIRVREWKGGTAPSYSLIATVTRFVAGSLGTALTAQAQSLVPLVHIVPRKTGYPDNIFLSNQRMTIGGQLYQERLLRWDGIQQVAVGVPGVSAESDDVTLVFGNADRVMRQLAADVQLDYARVEFSLLHPLTQHQARPVGRPGRPRRLAVEHRTRVHAQVLGLPVEPTPALLQTGSSTASVPSSITTASPARSPPRARWISRTSRRPHRLPATAATKPPTDAWRTA